MENKRAPEYLVRPLHAFLDYMEESDKLISAAMQGMSVLRAVPKTIEALANFEQRDAEADLQRATEVAEFCNREVARGFPLLHAHFVVGIWGAIEAVVEDVVIAILSNEPKYLEREFWAKTKIPLAQFEALEKEDRLRLLVGEAERTHLAGKRGTDKYEILLQEVGISGSIEPRVKKLIWEMYHVRNVIVHRSGFADRTLIHACPWLDLSVGDQLAVSHQMLEAYSNASSGYVLEVMIRMTEKYNANSEFRARYSPHGRVKAAPVAAEDSDPNSTTGHI